jgi:hypothetical protein
MPAGETAHALWIGRERLEFGLDSQDLVLRC